MRVRRLGLLALLLCATVPASAQKPGTLAIDKACFDSIPYGEAHACNIVVISKNKIPPTALFTTLLQGLAIDTLSVAQRDSTDDRVLVVASLQPVRGRCASRFAGLDSLQPQIAVHFDATRRGKDTGAALAIRGSAITAAGVQANALALALCQSAYYLKALDFPDLRR